MIPNSNRELQASALLLDSITDEQGTQYLSLDVYYNAILVNQGTSALKTNLPIITSGSDDQYAAFITYGRQSSTDNARVPTKTISFGDPIVSLKLPGWRWGVQNLKETPPPKSIEILCQMFHRQSDNIPPEFNFTLHE